MIRVQRQSRRAEEPIKGQDNYPKKPQMKRRKAKQPHYLANLFLTKQANEHTRQILDVLKVGS